MTDSEQPKLALSVSTRDVQWLIGTMALCNSLMRSEMDATLENLKSMHHLLHAHYNGVEGNALMARLRALLPSDTPLLLVEHTEISGFAASTTSFVQ